MTEEYTDYSKIFKFLRMYMDEKKCENYKVAELQQMCEEKGIYWTRNMRKKELVDKCCMERFD